MESKRTLTGPWAIWNTEEAGQAALALCKGIYQRDIILGGEALSGSTLRGKAKGWGSAYTQSRFALLNRCREAGIAVSERTVQPGNRRVLVIG